MELLRYPVKIRYPGGTHKPLERRASALHIIRYRVRTLRKRGKMPGFSRSFGSARTPDIGGDFRVVRTNRLGYPIYRREQGSAGADSV